MRRPRARELVCRVSAARVTPATACDLAVHVLCRMRGVVANDLRMRCGLGADSVRTACDATATGEGTGRGPGAQEVRTPRAADANWLRCESGKLTPRFFQTRMAKARHNRWEQDHLPPPHLVVVSPRGTRTPNPLIKSWLLRVALPVCYGFGYEADPHHLHK